MGAAVVAVALDRLSVGDGAGSAGAAAVVATGFETGRALGAEVELAGARRNDVDRISVPSCGMDVAMIDRGISTTGAAVWVVEDESLVA